MPHIHELYDFVVSIFLVHRDKALLVYHKKYDEWVPIGGHIDLDEDPEEALFKEIREECGLKVRVLSTKPSIAHPGVKPILTPSYVDVHRISKTHKHIAFIYLGVASSDRVKLLEREHREYRWLSEKEIRIGALPLSPSIKFYALEALKAARKARR
jgi:8-oxo-dGTP pyrophosphatase MutT (NUDIX family)